jgi:hypothetical protein
MTVKLFLGKKYRSAQEINNDGVSNGENSGPNMNAPAQINFYLRTYLRWALHGKGGVRHAATNWIKQCGASTACRPLESTAVRAPGHEPPAGHFS